jgi:hypothetical protein
MSERRRAGRRAVDKDYPKTNQGRRSIDLDPETVTALRSRRVRQAERRLALGLRGADPGIVFTDVWAQPFIPDRVPRASTAGCTGPACPGSASTTSACATRRHVPGWVERPTSGLSQQAGEAEGSLTPEVRGRVASSPDNDGTGRYCQTARVRLARQRGVTPGAAFVTPPGLWHSHHNESGRPARILPIQDAGLHTYLRSLDIRFTR